MTAMIVLGVLGITCIGVCATQCVVALNRSAQEHSETLDRMQAEHHAEVMAREDLHDREVARILELHRQALVDVRLEREQIVRLQRSTDAQSYKVLEAAARIPDADLGEAERHRAEALASRTRRPDAAEPSPVMVDTSGDAIVPVGMGG